MNQSDNFSSILPQAWFIYDLFEGDDSDVFLDWNNWDAICFGRLVPCCAKDFLTTSETSAKLFHSEFKKPFGVGPCVIFRGESMTVQGGFIYRSFFCEYLFRLSLQFSGHSSHDSWLQRPGNCYLIRLF